MNPLPLLRLANPLVGRLLESRAHGLLSGALVVLTYRGRRSGREFRIPLQYAELADRPLGAAQAISDVVVTPQADQFFGDEANRQAFATDSATPIQPGEVTTRVTVNARFTID